jgi:hypothetical protein
MKIEKDLGKSAIERRIFRRFAEISTLPIAVDSVESRCPPEPDILCMVEGEGQVAFELVEIIDESFAKRTDAQIDMHNHIENLYESLPEIDKSILSHRLGDALIYICFKPGVSLKKKREIAKDILAHLKSTDLHFEGDVLLSANLKTLIRRITVFRGVVGPCFDIEGVGTLGDPILERLKEKFSKAYESHFPIELLAYYDLQPVRPDSHWLLKATIFIKDSIQQSPFRRVWMFDVHNERVIQWS